MLCSSVHRRQLGNLRHALVEYPDTWRMAQPDKPAHGVLFDVPEGSPEFLDVSRRLAAAMRGPRGCTGFGVRLLQLQRVQNNVLWRRYYHEREETKHRNGDANEKTLWMSSGDTDPKVVVENEHGFDPTYYPLKSYGSGAYFAQWPLYSHAWRPCAASRFRAGQAGHLIILAQVALGEVKNYGSEYARDLAREPDKPGGGQYDSWSGTEGNMRWSTPDSLRKHWQKMGVDIAPGLAAQYAGALQARGAEYGRQYIVCRYQKAYPQYIVRYQMT